MIAYASRTGTKENLDALRRAGWHLLVSATGVLRTEGFPYALDNGAYTAFQQKRSFDAERFQRALDRLGADAEFVVAPDVVADRESSLALTSDWLPRLVGLRRVLIAVQDGMVFDDVVPFLGENRGIFLGGSTQWKVRHIGRWGQWCSERGIYYHVARVNSIKRIRLCYEAGAASFDGTSATKYVATLPGLDAARVALIRAGEEGLRQISIATTQWREVRSYAIEKGVSIEEAANRLLRTALGRRAAVMKDARKRKQKS